MDAKKSITNIETNIRFGTVIIFTACWLYSGFDLAMKWTYLNKYLETLKCVSPNCNIFRLDSFLYLAICLGITFYPIFIVMILSFTFFDLKAFRELIVSKTFIYLLLSPVLIIFMFIIPIFVGAIVQTIVWIIFLTLLIYSIINHFKNNLK